MPLGLPWLAPEDLTGMKGTAPKKGNEGPFQATVQDYYHTQKKQRSEAKILSSTDSKVQIHYRFPKIEWVHRITA